MNPALVVRLVVKDWYLNRAMLGLIAAAGCGAVALLYLRTEVSGFIGLTGALIATIFLSILLPMSTVVNERKKQNLAFVMSLPISPADYTLAKIAGNVLAFLCVWLLISGSAIATIARAGSFGGLVPLMVIASLSPFVAFCAMLAVAIVLESELWATVVMGFSNVSYSFAWFFLIRIPQVQKDLKSPVPIWSPLMLRILTIEIVVIVAAIALTFFFQSRKRNFI